MLTAAMIPWNRLMAKQQLLLLLSSIGSMVLFTVATVPVAVHTGTHWPLSWPVTAVVYASLTVRRHFPLGTVAVSVIGSVVLMADGMVYPLTLLALFCALYWVALDSSPVRTLMVGVPVKATLLVASLITHPGITGVIIVMWAALAVTTGSAARSHRAYVAEAEERAKRAERAREEEANRRVAEERLRIARELHDAVGHHVALINVQAGALGYLLEDEDRTQALESVAHIQQASAEALEELRLTVGLLRQPGSTESAEPTEPVPGLDRLGDLICSFAGAGLQVTREVTGRARPLPEAVELTAYRVIQESLTNIRKHAGCVPATVRLGYGPGALRLAVEDDGEPVVRESRRAAAPAAAGAGTAGGHGIVGMRERVTAVGGRIAVGPRPEGGYRVFAELPLRAAGIEGV
ncbi:sensor histidine kinase [Kitasatospora sp. NPDC015120]|uniref:sensor histidine kinase n=1 Tax=Kitasatospora sp. NPDC015120 TaxID=3364023 RepID=UPI0036F4748B